MRTTIRIFRFRQRFYFYFSIAWLVGFVAGILVALQSATIHNSFAQSLLHSRLSVAGFLASLSFPFLLSAIFFKLSLGGLVLPLVFGKAFSYSWYACMLLTGFGDAGWLMCRLLAFSDSIVMVLLLWFWFRCLDRNNNRRQVDLLVCLVITLAIGCMDCCVISPFGISLFLHS